MSCKKVTSNRMKQPDSIPDYIDPDLWCDFIQHRKEIRHKLTDTTQKFILKKLARFHQDGMDVNAAIVQSIENGWQGIFAYYETNRTGNGQRETPVQRRERKADEYRAAIISH